jgi:WD40 repeat protein
MAPDSMVVEDGVEETGQQTRRAKPTWILVVVGFAFGLALGTVLPSTPGSVTPDTTGSTLLDGEEAAQASGVASAIPEFPNALVAISNGQSGSFEHVYWPVDGPALVQFAAALSEPSLDAKGQVIATLSEVPRLEERLLSIGRFNAVRPISTGVTSFAWHDTKTGELAFTAQEDDRLTLYRLTHNRIPQRVADNLASDSTVATWGDWGYAVQVGDQVSLLTPDGDFKDVEAGRSLASHGAGWLLVNDGDLKLVSAGGGVRRLELEGERSVSSAAFSPDGTLVALAGTSGVVILDVEESALVDIGADRASDWVSWSTDSRFVIMPASSGVFVHDLESGETHHVLTDHAIVAAKVFSTATS